MKTKLPEIVGPVNFGGDTVATFQPVNNDFQGRTYKGYGFYDGNEWHFCTSMQGIKHERKVHYAKNESH